MEGLRFRPLIMAVTWKIFSYFVSVVRFLMAAPYVIRTSPGGGQTLEIYLALHDMKCGIQGKYE